MSATIQRDRRFGTIHQGTVRSLLAYSGSQSE